MIIETTLFGDSSYGLLVLYVLVDLIFSRFLLNILRVSLVG